ncbi:MAG TPA: hypothetical protein VGE39_07470 [Prosthecobacter sp.]
MMTSPSIPRELPDKVVEDYFALRDEALNWLARWCAVPAAPGTADAGGKGWSDFNVHDPGVQIVEVVCHALTELAYRARVPVLTLLQDARGNIDWQAGALHAPPDVLPMGPLTAADYRKLLLDRFHQIHEVWLFPGADGRHRVWLCFENVPAAEQALVRRCAQDLLGRKRNLGEHFTVLIPPEPVQDGPLPGLDAETLSRLQDLMRQTPAEQPVLVSLAQRQQMGHSLADILTGPLLKHGSIPDSCMTPPQEWEQAQAPILAALEEAGAQAPTLAALMQALKPCVDAGPEESDGAWAMPGPRAAPSTHLLHFAGWKMPQADPVWQRQELTEFQPLQLSFPPNYALGADELDPSAPPLRHAQVRQLRGYLLHFEQLMRNYLAQLVHLPGLLSSRPQQQTYFAEPVYAVPDIMPLLKGYNAEGLSLSHEAERALTRGYQEDPVNPYRRQLATLDESPHEFARRRNQFLDHLLARFGESYGPAKGATYETIHNKEELLQHLPELGLRRAAAGGPEHVSGLEAKITLLLQRDAPPPDETAPDKFYYLLEDGQLSGDAPDAFGLTHVLVNWTGNRLDPAFEEQVEALIAEHAAAHLCHTFLWLEKDKDAEDAARLQHFRERHVAWCNARTRADTGIIATAAAGLWAWLRAQIPRAASAEETEVM